jgi:prepilin peptidase CpaA
MTSTLISLVLLAITFVAAFTDVRTGLIPNWLTLPTLALAPLVQLALGGTHALAMSIIGCVVCGLVPLCLFRAGAMGGGDVKLLSGIGALAGPLAGLEVQLLAYNMLVAFALIVLALRGELRAVLRRTWRLLVRGRAARDPEATDARDVLTTFRLGAPIFVAVLALTALEVVR